MQYFGYENIKEWLMSSFGIKLLKTFHLEVFLFSIIGIAIFVLGIDRFLHGVGTYIFVPPIVFILTLVTIIADTVAGAYKGHRTAEGFQGKKALRMFPKLIAVGGFLLLFHYILKYMILELDAELSKNFNVVIFKHIINIIKIIVALTLTGIYGRSCLRNMALAGIMPKVFVKWFEDKAEKYVEKVDNLI